MLTKKTLQQIKKIAIGIDHDAAFGGKSKGNKHLERAVKIAKFLAKKEGADLAITEAGAWLHDSALPTGNDYDPVKNAKIVRKILRDVDLTVVEVEQIAQCAASHEGTKKAVSLEAQIVHDCDVIEKTGLLGLIRHTWKLTNSNKLNPSHITTADTTLVLDHIAWRKKQLRLSRSRKLARSVSVKISKEQAKNVVAIVAPLAARGFITEIIARRISSVLSQEQKEALRSQLSLAYLK